jgi:hypothetical protein
VATSDLVIERYELKYRIPPDLAPRIRDAVRPFVRPDSASAHGPYTISSLYFDTTDRLLYQQTLDQAPRRFKLRVRRYRTGPYFIECKQRIRDVIVKTRVAISPEAWPHVLRAPDGERWVTSPRDLQNLGVFTQRLRRTGAAPLVVVRYEREAFVSLVDDYGRVTFDHRLCALPAVGWELPIDGVGWLPVDSPDRFGLPMSGVVLELKCTATVPLWMSDLVREFGLVRTGFSKYCASVERIDEAAGDRDRWMNREAAPWLSRERP